MLGVSITEDMAEKAVEKLDKQLDCSICLETYTEPKLLQCLHVYCLKCLIKLAVRDRQGHLSLTCPTCRKVTPVPASGVASLQSAFHINHLLEIRGTLKEAAQKIQPCIQHAKECQLYCMTCEELICFHCVLKDADHHSHDYELLSESKESPASGDESSLEEQLVSRLTAGTVALTQVDTCQGEISNQRQFIEADIHKSFGNVQEVLDLRKTELIGQLHQMTQEKLKSLSIQRDQLETTQAKLNRALSQMRMSVGTDQQDSVTQQVYQLVASFQPESLKLNAEADITFSVHPGFITQCQSYGELLDNGCTSDMPESSAPTPNMCEAECIGAEVSRYKHHESFVGQPYDIVISLEGSPNEPKLLEGELVSEITGAKTRCTFSPKLSKSGLYDSCVITCRPVVKGKHQLCIRGGKGDINGIFITVKLPVVDLGVEIHSVSRIEKPWGSAFLGGKLVVSENHGNCVSVFSSSGVRFLSFGTRGSGQGQFQSPRGVAVDGEGNILVADYENHRVQKFTENGHYFASVGSKGKKRHQFLYPSGIAFNPCNSCVYVSDQNHRIQVLNSDLSFSNSFGRSGSGKGEFRLPRGVACDSAGNVYVADRENHRVQVFTAEGKFLRAFGRSGRGRGKMKWPIGVAVDADNFVYVSEFGNCRVSVFTSEGGFVTAFGKEGYGPGLFRGPSALTVDSNGLLCVCDYESGCVKLF